MKKKFSKIFLSILALCMGFVFGSSFLPKNTTANAFTSDAQTYTISQTASGFDVSFNADSPTEVVSETTIENVFSAIETHATQNSISEHKIVFSNITLAENSQITINKTTTLSGTINSTNSTSVFVINNTDSSNAITITFDDFSLNNTIADETKLNLVEVAETSNTANLIMINSSFEHTATNAVAEEPNTYAIYFKSTNHSISLKNTVTHTTKFLYNYIKNTTLNIDDDTFFKNEHGEALENTEKLYVSAPYDALNAIICSNISETNAARFEILPDSNDYTISKLFASTTLCATSELKITFDTNNGILKADYTIPSKYNFIMSDVYAITFPTNEEISREHYAFDGWFGTIEYNSQTYYFDQTVLKTFIENGLDKDTIPTYFKQDLSEFSIDTSFLGYKYSSKGTTYEYSNYSAIYAFAELDTIPNFIAKWNINTNTITFDTMGGDFSTDSNYTTNSKFYDFGSNIAKPANPTKVGYTFENWYKDEDLTNLFNFETETMAEEPIIVYAKWNLNSHAITFDTKGGNFVTNATYSTNSKVYDFGSNIAKPTNPTKIGYTFNGWYKDDAFTTAFNFNTETMPDEPVTLYAKWVLKTFTIVFNTNGGTSIQNQTIGYNQELRKPTNPTKIGSTFSDWYYDKNCTSGNHVVFEYNSQENYYYLPITQSKTLYAKWTLNTYHIQIHTGINGEIKNIPNYYNMPVILPSDLTLQNHAFGGWYANENFTQAFSLQTMPAEDITVYAYWIAKPQITLDETAQIFTYGNGFAEFNLNTNLDGFLVKYLVNNEWQLIVPEEIGSYDVLITRNEDNTYASYSKTISKGFVIEPVVGNYSWIYAVLFVVAAAEIILAIVLRKMRKMKVDMVASLVIPIGTSIIPENQVILIIVSGTLAIFGLILLIYEFVSLHRTIPVSLLEKEDEKTDMEKQFEHNQKVLNEIKIEYSAADVERLLDNDSVGKSIRQKHNLVSSEQDDGKIYESIELVDEDKFEDMNENEIHYSDNYDSLNKHDPTEYSNTTIKNDDNE